MEEEIQREYMKLSDYNHDRCQVYAQIIELKLAIQSTYKHPVYVDVKKWIRMSLEDNDIKDFGYDELKIDRFKEIIDRLPLCQRISIYRFAQRLFRQVGLDYTPIVKNIKRLQLQEYQENHKCGRMLLYHAGNSIWCTAILVLLSVVVLALVLMEAPLQWMCCFDVNLLDVSENAFVNRLMNAVLIAVDFDFESPLLKPISIIGVVSYALIKVLIILIPINFLYQKLLSNIDSLVTIE